MGRLLHAWVAFCIQGRLLGVSRLLPAWVALGRAPSSVFSSVRFKMPLHCWAAGVEQGLCRRVALGQTLTLDALDSERCRLISSHIIGLLW